MAKLRKIEITEIKKLIIRMGLKDILPKLEKTPRFWEQMSIKLVDIYIQPGDFNIPRFLFDEFKERLHVILFHLREPLPGTTENFTLYEIFVWIRILKLSIGSTFRPEAVVWKRLQEIIEPFDDAREGCTVKLGEWAALTAGYFGDPTTYYYYTDFEIVSGSGRDEPPQIWIRLMRSEAQRRQITLESHKRSVYRLRCYYAFDDAYSPEIEIEGHLFDTYIQGHVLTRLEERLDTIKLRNSRLFMCRNVGIAPTITFNNTLLVPFTVGGKKLGYFVAEIHNDFCVLLTFLFLSQDGTPEGEKLNETLSLNKREKKFLSLEKLSHFTHSDINEDPQILKILQECSLDHLKDVRLLMEHEEIENAEFLKDTLQIESVVQTLPQSEPVSITEIEPVVQENHGVSEPIVETPSIPSVASLSHLWSSKKESSWPGVTGQSPTPLNFYTPFEEKTSPVTRHLIIGRKKKQ